MEEQNRDGLKKKIIIVKKRKVETNDKPLQQPKKKLRVVVKRKPEPIPEVVVVNIQEEPKIEPVHIVITVPKKTRTRKVREAKVEVKTDEEVKPKRTRRKKITKEDDITSEEKPKAKRTRKTSPKSKVEKKPVPVYDPDPFLEREVSALNIARCLRKTKDIIKGVIDF